MSEVKDKPYQVHPMPLGWSWYASQPHEQPDSTFGIRCVQIRQKGTDRLLTTILPPGEWGDQWSWEMTGCGTGVVLVDER